MLTGVDPRRLEALNAGYPTEPRPPDDCEEPPEASHTSPPSSPTRLGLQPQARLRLMRVKSGHGPPSPMSPVATKADRAAASRSARLAFRPSCPTSPGVPTSPTSRRSGLVVLAPPWKGASAPRLVDERPSRRHPPVIPAFEAAVTTRGRARMPPERRQARTPGPQGLCDDVKAAHGQVAHLGQRDVPHGRVRSSAADEPPIGVQSTIPRRKGTLSETS